MARCVPDINTQFSKLRNKSITYYTDEEYINAFIVPHFIGQPFDALIIPVHFSFGKEAKSFKISTGMVPKRFRPLLIQEVVTCDGVLSR